MDTQDTNELPRGMVRVDGLPDGAVPCDDRGLAYGDGLFETMAWVDGEIRHWARHFSRLHRSAARLHLSCPPAELWLADLADLCASLPATCARAVLKLTLTRGSGARGYAPLAGLAPRRIVQCLPWPEAPTDTGRLPLVIQCTTPLACNPALAGMKHLNRLEQVLAAREASLAGAQEGLVFDTGGRLVSGTRGNVFLLLDGALYTPPVDQAGVAGIMREILLEEAPGLGFPVRVGVLSQAELARCTGVLITNCLRGGQIVERLRHAAGTRQFDPRPLQGLREGLRSLRLAP